MTHHDVRRLRNPSLELQDILAVGERFELSKGVNPCWFSRPVHSTALPPHRQNVRRLLAAVTFYLRQTDNNGFFSPKSALPPPFKLLDFRAEVLIL